MSERLDTYIDLRGPVVVLMLAATAVPVDLRLPVAFGHSFQLFDFLLNVGGYLQVGLVFGRMAWLRALVVAGTISFFAECFQCVMLLRDPSIIDIAANVTGAWAGFGLGTIWKIGPLVRLRTWMAGPAILLAAGPVGMAIVSANPGLNLGDATTMGPIEAHWTFDEIDGRRVLDSSRKGLDGILRGEAKRVAGIHGGAIALDGTGDYIDVGNARQFFATGSLTVSAWIQIRGDSANDAAIVSDLRADGDFNTGFQLDTTVDSGPRTIGFKLGDACGRYFARYGATPLLRNTWYFVSGTYDAKARTIHVYLNGQLDDGRLVGTVPDSRRASREPVRIGRRAEFQSFDFAGVVDDVRIYSRALSREDIAANLAGTQTGTNARPASDRQFGSPAPVAPFVCTPLPEPRKARLGDARLPALAALFGALVSVAVLATRRRLAAPLAILLGASGGYILLHFAAPALPFFNLWMFPLTGAAAAFSVIASARKMQKA